MRRSSPGYRSLSRSLGSHVELAALAKIILHTYFTQPRFRHQL
jgi:hypothetical protein